MLQKIKLAEKLASFSDHWSPKIAGNYNGNDIMLVKVLGEFVWHKHDDTDDFFLVIDGEVTIETENGNVTLGPGELYVVPKGVMHRPVAHVETHLLLIEPGGTPNTGDPATAVQKSTI